jgi:hypothetical protein
VCTTALKPFVILESVLNLDNTVGKYIPRNWSHQTGTQTYDILEWYWPTIDFQRGGDFVRSDGQSRQNEGT